MSTGDMFDSYEDDDDDGSSILTMFFEAWIF
jgi:hypothetical protein